MPAATRRAFGPAGSPARSWRSGYWQPPLFATGWFTHDPATVRNYADSLSTAHYGSYHTHFRTIAGFVVSENLDTALIGALVWFPLIGLAFGALGGLVGSSVRRTQSA